METINLPQASKPVPIKRQRILVVDDVRDNRFLVECLLRSLDVSLRSVASGYEAVQAVSEQFPDLILMDIQMPGMDGYEATRRIRALGYTGPIVAVTAHSIGTELERCLRVGCDSVLMKPISRRQLIEWVL